jgi:hypothetical protein
MVCIIIAFQCKEKNMNKDRNNPKKPYHRNCRQFVDGHYSEGGRWQYMMHPKYACSPGHYVRSLLLIQNDLQKLFEYIEPADVNATCYSYRIHELLMRACIEVEANCKAILSENIYTGKPCDWNMHDYRKLNITHRLSSYKVKLPIWRGEQGVRQPFKRWNHNSNENSLEWYQAYNAAKHNRHEKFEEANLYNLIDAICGLLVLLSAQFHTNDFSPGPFLLSCGDYNNDMMESAIGGYFRISFPEDWLDEEKYDFDWQILQTDPSPFDKINYSEL